MTVDYLPPLELTSAMLDSGITKAKLGVSDMLIRGALAGAFVGLGITVLAAAGVLSGNGLVGAVLFPFCFILIALLSLEFFTGNCALLPFAAFAGRVSLGQVLRNWVFVYIGHLIGALIYGFLYAAVSTKFFTDAPDPVGAKVMAIGVAKVMPYMHAGAAGWWTALVKGVFATWMVSLAAVMALVSRSVDRQDRRRLAADHGLRGDGLRALRGEHVRHPDRDHAGRADHRQPVADLEPDPGHHRQHYRRHDLHRPGAVCDLQAGHVQSRGFGPHGCRRRISGRAEI